VAIVEQETHDTSADDESGATPSSADPAQPVEEATLRSPLEKAALASGDTDERDQLEAELEDPDGFGDSLTVDELFLRVNSVIPEAQHLSTIEPGSSSRDALALMAEQGYSQLPIVRGKRVIGLFSYGSFSMAAKDARSTPGDLPVEEAMETPVWVRATDELEPLIDVLDARNAVLVGDEDDLQAIVTGMDVLRCQDELARPFVHLRGIELALRKLVGAAMNESNFAQLSTAALETAYADRTDDPPSTIEGTSLGELIAVVLHGPSWAYMKSTLGANRANAVTHLEGLSGPRNDVLHFRRPLTEEELSRIKTTSDWLRMRMRASGLPEGTND
jgi:CBS domain-containing protein